METNKTILQMKYGRIVKAFAKEAGISLDEALDKFYNSNTFILMDEGIADMQTMSDIYLTDELLIEYGYKKQPGTEKTVA
ncbi:DUF3791 domain-containing protein [Prevotella sp. P5-108]|uniref:DUF3791 domain-containing protein n=1 Tax=Prevotella sp. P5-108 TaxID=2024225 RepID=UPI000B97A484|nr:DUF3791 domain-containing protein [Prevotella sp. P5-108]OYP63274.1 DUF3791 domain-containing protein [Prevotella sp. P5-108]